MSAATASESNQTKRTAKDFASDQEVRWCPGCGDYAILKVVQKVLPELGIPREQIVFVSGIGCSSRFPYYLNTYGFHTIHGRAAPIATGIKVSRPDLSVWVITGDGDSLSIGTNHLVHALRRNLDINILLFNNRIYGLTKGQYSPTSEFGKKTPSSPGGSISAPLNPILLAIASQASFVARTLDRDVQHLGEVITQAALHKGSSFVEIYQDCHVFNAEAFSQFTDKAKRPDNTVRMEHGRPLLFGANEEKGIRLNGLRLETVELNGRTPEDAGVLVYDSKTEDRALAMLLAQVTGTDGLPLPIGIFRQENRPCFEELEVAARRQAIETRGAGDLAALFRSGDTWEVAARG